MACNGQAEHSLEESCDFLPNTIYLEDAVPLVEYTLEYDAVQECEYANVLSFTTMVRIHEGIPKVTFDDYNFDGYLDMRLLSFADSGEGLLTFEYFRLWDTS